MYADQQLVEKESNKETPSQKDVDIVRYRTSDILLESRAYNAHAQVFMGPF